MFELLEADYTNEYSCFTKNVTKDVCVCPKGFTNYDCANAEYSKCFLNITKPAFYEGCSDLPDSPYSLYSIPGYDPCFFFNFTETYNIEFMIQC